MYMHIVAAMATSPSTQNSPAAAAAPPAPRAAVLADQAWSPRLWAILFVLCGALFLDALDVSMIGVALPVIRTDLHLDTSSLQWIVSAYVLGYGGLLLLGGRAAGLLGRGPGFLVALGPFAGGRLAAGGGGRRGPPADRGPVRQGHGRRGHRTGRAVPADHHVPRGPDAQSGHQYLLRLRGQWFLPRPGPVRSADRGELAVDAAAAGTGRAGHAAGRDSADPAGRAGQPSRAAVRRAGRPGRDRGHDAAGVH